MKAFLDVRNFASPLPELHIFVLKEHLKIAIGEFHINMNLEVKYSTSSQSKLVAECINDSCMWRLYATPTKIGSCWQIRKCPYSHTCRALANRTDHS